MVNSQKQETEYHKSEMYQDLMRQIEVSGDGLADFITGTEQKLSRRIHELRSEVNELTKLINAHLAK